MSEPFLILHKVRGDPAFDVATRMTCPLCRTYEYVETVAVAESNAGCDECEGAGYWWIIPTSGHRAYPYWDKRLEDIFFVGAIVPGFDYPLELPKDWPDHYPLTRSADKPKLDLSGLLSKIVPLTISKDRR